MKSKSCVSTALLFILVLGLTACRSGVSEGTAAPSTRAGDPIVGEGIFAGACATCHGSRGEGIAGLSGDMTQSKLIADNTDRELIEYIKIGGAPGAQPVMLPKGGNPTLNDENLSDIVAYLRSLQK
jgi:mono/diheme cytochrome c family protein